MFSLTGIKIEVLDPPLGSLNVDPVPPGISKVRGQDKNPE